MMQPTPQRVFLLTLIALTGCASSVTLPSKDQVQSDTQAQIAAQWYTTYSPLPHSGSTASLQNWWAEQGDPLLTELMAAAQKNSASLAAAQTRIAQARAAVLQAEQAYTPQAGIGIDGSRSVQAPKAPPVSSARVGVQASWEIDIWGGKRAAATAAQLRARGAELAWHEGRVLVAAELASSYYGYQHCLQALSVLQNDAASRMETARLAQITANAGFSAPATAQLALASSADAAAQVIATQAQCEAQLKALVALTATEEPQLKAKFLEYQSKAQIKSAPNAMLLVANAVPKLPAQLLAQRPDVAAAQDAVLAASMDARAADSARYPALSLSGNLGLGVQRAVGISTEGAQWSIGPVSLSLPLSQTTIRSNTEAAVAAYKQAVAQLRSTARQAVREVETSLLELNATQQRGEQAKLAAQGYGAALAATQARYRAGLASLVELEDARRTALFAQQNQLTVERDRIAAWINLYRATGGGWTADKPVRIGAALTTETAATASSNSAEKTHDLQKTSPVTASLSPATPATQP